MKPLEKIEKIVKKFSVDTNEERNELVLNELLEAQAKSKKTKSALAESNIWRIIMKSNITKLTAAAVIIIVITIALNQFGTSIDGASTAWAKVVEKTNRMPWMHAIAKLEQYKDHSSIAPGGFEIWLNIASKINISIGDYIKYEDYTNKIRYFYNPEDDSLQITAISGSWEETKGLQTNSDLLNRFLSLPSHFEGDIDKSTGEYQGKKVDIYTIVVRDEKNGLNATLEVLVDPDTNLIIVILQKMEDLSGQHLADAEITFSYPEKGPVDIYELGVPRTAKINNYLDNTKD